MGKHGPPLKTARYPYVVIKGHPLAHGDGRVRVHRAALYDQIGEGPHACHWCGKKLDWHTPPKIVVDHVNGDTWDNSEENLVPACHRCNSTRHQTQKTHCKRGHEYSEENTYWRTTAKGKSRVCRTCHRERHKGYVIARPEAFAPKRLGLKISLRGATLDDLRRLVEQHQDDDGSLPIFIAYGRNSERQVTKKRRKETRNGAHSDDKTVDVHQFDG